MIKINSLGLGSVKLTSNNITIYIDAFVDDKHIMEPFFLEKADLILVTHDHPDHFCAKKVAYAAKKTGAIVVGPPNIAYPLIVNEKLQPEQLHVYYPEYWKDPIVIKVKEIPLKIYQSSHFGQNEPIHLSFFIKLEGKKIYHTGDSLIINEDDPDLHKLDVLFCNLVSMNPEKVEYVSILEPFLKKFNPHNLLPVHLIKCDWTIKISDVKKEIVKRGYQNVTILENEQQTFEIK